MALRNKIEFKVFGMRRSGNHAVIHWAASHYGKKCWLVNDIYDFSRPAVLDKDYIKAAKLDCFKVSHEPDFWTKDKGILIQTYEDYDLSDLDWEANEKVVGDSESERSMLVIRDPFNLMASRAAKNQAHLIEVSRMAMDRWKQHAREALGETSFLRNKVVVNYNRWFSENDYRRELESQLGLPGDTDETMNMVVMAGSSFKKCETHEGAMGMSVCDRWKFFTGFKWYLDMFDRRTKELAEMLGFPCPWGSQDD